VPIRLLATEQAVVGKRVDSPVLAQARDAALSEVHPIDDIRSTARYRAVVAGNLVIEFLRLLNSESTKAEHSGTSNVLTRWNSLPVDEAISEILPCCGSRAWAQDVVARRPFAEESELLTASTETWRRLTGSDWIEAFQSHPRIGGSRAPQAASAQSEAWSTQEQQKVAEADDAAKIALADANREYERRFGRIFIICATGKSAPRILEALRRRLNNDGETELQEAAEQQRQITEIRLRKWLQI
jgi:2-oxo-4-hydroxy-4-carboxy-5-ureidoimidazoline decarboxylase